ncbi:MAG: hypothetical protein K0Q60_3862 [Microvirga sp.]|nr:hypothetical protein [Microvirga sp.]
MRNFGGNLCELLLGREPVLRYGRHAGADLTSQARDADHEELVQVLGRDRQEAQLLQERMVAVGGLLQHPPVELQPGQLAIDEALRETPQGCAIELDIRRSLRQGSLADGLHLFQGNRAAHLVLRRFVLRRPFCSGLRDGFTTVRQQGVSVWLHSFSSVSCAAPRISAAIARETRRPRLRASRSRRATISEALASERSIRRAI